MKVIDARSGAELANIRPCPHTGLMPGVQMWADNAAPTVSYGDGESVTLLAVEPGLLSARARVRSVHRDYKTGETVASTNWVPLSVRWFHPRFLLQHVAFIPS